MSLLNQMLRDLERREMRAPNDHPVTTGVRSVSAPARRWKVVVIALTSLGLALVAGYAYRRQIEERFQGLSQAMATTAPEASPAPTPPNTTDSPASSAVVEATSPPAPSATAVATTDTTVLAVAAATSTATTELRSTPQTVVSAQTTGGSTAPITPSTAMRQGQVQKSVTPAQQAQQLHQQALDLLQEGKIAEGMDRLQAALTLEPSRHEARHQLAVLQLQLRQTQAAENLLMAGLRWPEATPLLTPLLGRMALESSNPAQAEVWLRKGLAHSPQDPMLNGLLGTALREQQRFEEATAHYLAALRQDPSMPSWLIGIALCWEKMGLREDAREALERAARSGRLSGELRGFVEARLTLLREPQGQSD